MGHSLLNISISDYLWLSLPLFAKASDLFWWITLRHNWHKINFTCLKCTIWQFLTYVCIHKSSMQLRYWIYPLLLKSFLLLLCNTSLLSLFIPLSPFPDNHYYSWVKYGMETRNTYWNCEPILPEYKLTKRAVGKRDGSALSSNI